MNSNPLQVQSIFLNDAAQRGTYPQTLTPTLSRAAGALAFSCISTWKGYEATPLVNLSGLAAAFNVKSIEYKQESGRFNLGSFKALGGAYAVVRLLAKLMSDKTGSAVTENDILSGQYKALVADVTVCCATDGNHGRSVAWGGQMLGCNVAIFIHATVSEGRSDAIRSYGADVIRTPGNYDDSVREAARMADENGWYVVSDTSYPGYTSVPRDVMQGYSVMVEEMMQQCIQPPTHVFIQGGVGGLAAAVAATLWEAYGDSRPTLVVVEPDQAACLFDSAKAGEVTSVTGDLDTIMAGLACGEPSLIAWPILAQGADAFVTIDDKAAAHVMRLLATGTGPDTPRLIAGESAVAGLAGFLSLDDAQRGSLGITSQSRIVFFGSEGDTDPAVYTGIVGQSGDGLRSQGAF